MTEWLLKFVCIPLTVPIRIHVHVLPVVQTEDLKTKKREREELGVQLYGVQQELARQQMLLEKEHDHYNSENQLRLQCEKLLDETKEMHGKITEDLSHQRKQGKCACGFKTKD